MVGIRRKTGLTSRDFGVGYRRSGRVFASKSGSLKTAIRAPRPSRKSGEKKRDWTPLVAAIITGVIGVVIGQYMGMLTAENTNDAVSRQQVYGLQNQKEQEDREKRREAYFDYIKSVDSYFQAAYIYYGCFDESQVFFFDATFKLPDSCREEMSLEEVRSRYSTYRDSKAKILVYGTKSARSHVEKIERALPKVDLDDPTGLTVFPWGDYRGFGPLYSEFHRIARCDLLATQEAGQVC